MAWDANRPRARQGKRLPAVKRRRIIKRDRDLNAGCYFLFLDICLGIEQPLVEVHHIKEVEDGGDEDDLNLATACRPCHQRFSARQSQKRAVKAGNDWKRKPEKHPGVLD